MPITTTAILPPEVQNSFGLKLLATPTPRMIHNIAADKKRMPANGGSVFTQRRYNPLEPALAPLGNSGVTPSSQDLSAVDINAQIAFYGTWVAISDQVTLTVQDPVLNAAALRLSVSLRQTEDLLTRNMLLATAGQIASVGGINGDSPSEMTLEDIDSVVTSLASANAYTIMDNVEGENKFGTAPVRDAYWAMTSTNLITTLNNIDGFIAKAQYPSQMNVLPAEWGSVVNVRFLVSSLGSVTSNGSALGNDVYNTFVTGLQAYAAIDVDRYNTQFIYLPPYIAGGPLGLFATAGWKFARAQVIQNDEWVTNLTSTIA